GPPGETGTVTLGYSIFPAFQRQGYATEAAHILTEWALAQPEVLRVRATISPRNTASQRVAAAAGLQPTGATEDDPDEGPVMVWQRTRGQG
ncbi:MAG: GNAT family N-acetyltransferase, partial [Thermomicrobiales bacterium]|nr:GNAT family N-acetyltransferase [Thermomicrobiales bacterium]